MGVSVEQSDVPLHEQRLPPFVHPASVGPASPGCPPLLLSLPSDPASLPWSSPESSFEASDRSSPVASGLEARSGMSYVHAKHATITAATTTGAVRMPTV